MWPRAEDLLDKPTLMEYKNMHSGFKKSKDHRWPNSNQYDSVICYTLIIHSLSLHLTYPRHTVLRFIKAKDKESLPRLSHPFGAISTYPREHPDVVPKVDEKPMHTGIWDATHGPS